MGIDSHGSNGHSYSHTGCFPFLPIPIPNVVTNSHYHGNPMGFPFPLGIPFPWSSLIRWQLGVVVNALSPINEAALHRARLVVGWVTVGRQICNQSPRSTQPGRPSVNTSGKQRRTAGCTSPISVVWQCKLMSARMLRKRRSAPTYGPCVSERIYS